MPHITPLSIRLWAKVRLPLTSEGIPCDDPDQCWEFTGNRTTGKYGYGQIREGPPHQKLIKAHRAAFQLLHGPIPEGLEVCHACDNVICINAVGHLYADTHQHNMADYIKKWGGVARKKSLLTLSQLALDLKALPGEPPVYTDLRYYADVE